MAHVPTLTNQIGIASVISVTQGGVDVWKVTFANEYTTIPHISVSLWDTNGLSAASSIFYATTVPTSVFIYMSDATVFKLGGFTIEVKGTIAPPP